MQLNSSTVALVTAAGLAAPAVMAGGFSPLQIVAITLATAAGSVFAGHVNDSGFWMFKEYMGLSLKDTFRSWTLMETLVGLFGLLFVMLLSIFV